jgi:hypothetical protein
VVVGIETVTSPTITFLAWRFLSLRSAAEWPPDIGNRDGTGPVLGYKFQRLLPAQSGLHRKLAATTPITFQDAIVATGMFRLPHVF